MAEADSKNGQEKNDDAGQEKIDSGSKDMIDTTKQSDVVATAKESDDKSTSSSTSRKKEKAVSRSDEDDLIETSSITMEKKDDEKKNALSVQKKIEEDAENEIEEIITKEEETKKTSSKSSNKKRKSAPASPTTTVRDLRERKTTVNYNPVDYFEIMTTELDYESSPKSTTSKKNKKKKKKSNRTKSDLESSLPIKDKKGDENSKELEQNKSEVDDEDVSPPVGNKKKSKVTSKKRKAASSPVPTVRDLRERKRVRHNNNPVTEVLENLGDDKQTDPEEDGPQPGRGIRLSGLDHVKDAINAAAMEDLMMAYRFVYWKGARTKMKMTKKDVKQSILSFSGYLPVQDPKLSKAEQAEVDEGFEVIMGQKAYKLTVPQLKKLCDTFGIDRRGMSGNKEDLVNCLLDFLGEPVTMDKFEKIRSSSTASKKKKKNPDDEERSADEETKDNTNESYEEMKDDDYWEDAMLVDGAEVTDETLRLWVRAFVRCHNIKSTTLKQAVAIATEKFGADMTDKTAQIKDLLVEEA